MAIYTARRPILTELAAITPSHISPIANLAVLVQEHRSPDELITRLQSDPQHDAIQVARLKKRKLQLKDEIAQLSKSVSFQ